MMRIRRRYIIVVVIIHVLSFTIKIRRTLVFVGTSIILVSGQDLSDITTRVLIQLLVIPKDYDRDVDGTEDGKLMRLLEQAAFAFEERY
jgi:hypothetical protein